VIKLAALADIWIWEIWSYNDYPVLFYDWLEPDLAGINSYKEDQDSGKEINFISFQDFSAKIKGEYNEKELIIDIGLYDTGEVLETSMAYLRTYVFKSIFYIDPGKYKLVRVEDEK
jgi:hypothetical protein